MNKKVRKVLLVGALCALLVLAMAVPAFAAHTGDPATIGDVKHEVLDEATPYVAGIAGIVIALFGLVLLATLARKVAGMARGTIRKG